MNDINPNDVDRALAAFGAQPMTYRSFEKHRLPAAAHAVTPLVLDDMAFDPFAPQPVTHALDERLPDILLPATPLVEQSSSAEGGKAMALAPPAPVLPPVPREADREPRVEPPVAASLPVIRAVPPLQGTAAPAGVTQPVARPSSGLSLPTLGAKFAAREKPRAETREDNLPAKSLADMFQLLNGPPGLARREAGSSPS